MNKRTRGDVLALRHITSASNLELFYRTLLRDIAFYDVAKLAIISIPLNQIQLLVNKVIRARVERAEALLHVYLSNGLTPFEPIAIRKGDGKFAVVSPSAAELAGTYLVMDGSHRVVAAKLAGLKEIVCLVIESVNLPPPASDPCATAEVEIVQGVAHWTDRVVNFRPELFRPVPMILDAFNEQLYDLPQMRKTFHDVG